MTTFNKFLELSGELREQVYEYYIEPAHPACRRTEAPGWPTLTINQDACFSGRSHKVAKFLPELAFTDKQVRNEVVHVMLRRIEKVVVADWWAADYLKDFLNAFDGFGLVTNLEFAGFDVVSNAGGVTSRPKGFANNNSEKVLLQRCENLHTITLTLRCVSICDKDERGRVNKATPPETIVQKFKLAEVLECKSLRRVRLIGCIPGFNDLWAERSHGPIVQGPVITQGSGFTQGPIVACVINHMAGLKDVGVRMKKESVKRGREVAVSVVKRWPASSWGPTTTGTVPRTRPDEEKML